MVGPPWHIGCGLLTRTMHLQNLKKGRGSVGTGWLVIESSANDLHNTTGKVGVICVALGCLHSAQELHSTIGHWVLHIACIRVATAWTEADAADCNLAYWGGWSNGQCL